MLKSQLALSPSEMQIMELLWSAGRPLTSVEMIEMIDAQNNTYIHVLLRSLQKKGLITSCGTERYGTQYARLFVPVMSKEQYAAKMVLQLKIERKVIPKLTLALVEETECNNEEVIAELEAIISDLKKNKKL